MDLQKLSGNGFLHLWDCLLICAFSLPGSGAPTVARHRFFLATYCLRAMSAALSLREPNSFDILVDGPTSGVEKIESPLQFRQYSDRE